MEFFKKRANAWFIATMIIILASLLGSASSLNKIRDKTENIFYMGEDKDGTGIQHDLDMIMSDSANLLVVANRYMDKDDSLVSNVEKKREELATAKTPGKKFIKTQDLLQEISELYIVMGDLNLSEKDQNYRDSVYANINSHNIIISRSSYNQSARDFNKLLTNFPANILSTIAFIRPLELYE